MSNEGTRRDKCMRASFAGTILRIISGKDPAMVHSFTACDIAPFSTQKPDAPRE
jgi:hypothetical protein